MSQALASVNGVVSSSGNLYSTGGDGSRRWSAALMRWRGVHVRMRRRWVARYPKTIHQSVSAAPRGYAQLVDRVVWALMCSQLWLCVHVLHARAHRTHGFDVPDTATHCCVRRASSTKRVPVIDSGNIGRSLGIQTATDLKSGRGTAVQSTCVACICDVYVTHAHAVCVAGAGKPLQPPWGHTCATWPARDARSVRAWN